MPQDLIALMRRESAQQMVLFKCASVHRYAKCLKIKVFWGKPCISFWPAGERR